MENNFNNIKEAVLKQLEGKGACHEQYSRVKNAATEEDLLQVAKDNLGWCSENNVCPDNILALFTPEKLLAAGIANTGEGNTGLANTGDRNTGDRNTGDRNTGYWNTGDRNTGNWNTGDRNTGNWNTGDRNTGDRNTGDRNTGDRNTGYRNTGDRNTGYWNTGYWNTGYWNTGDWNTGDRNTGDRNTGDRNTGYWNTGYWNTGDRNTGYSNTGDRNTGAFCTGDPGFPIFNQPSSWTEQQFKESKAYQLLCQVDTKQWVPSSHMTEEEKAKYPSHVTCEGYLKDIPFKEAFPNAWHNWSTESRQAFLDLPNFSAEIFFEITGVKVD